MLFNSIEFLVFFPLVVIGYFITPYRWRWLLLLIASYIFYGSWKIEFLSLIALSTLVDFIVAQKLGKQEASQKRWRLLALSLMVNLGLLGFFKYGAFFADILFNYVPIPDWRKDQVSSLLAFDLPVGISFYTFQTMGYSIDVFKGKVKPEKHIGKFALYVSYFPQLVAGPIERFSHLQPQLLARHIFSYKNLSHGLRLMLYGLFVKTVVADNIAPLVDKVFAAPLSYSNPTRWASILGFGWQIYADFYGYSLIAIGAARCFGVELMDNFNLPYSATSIKDFWRRWHISLSTWFRDYVFVPLGGSQVNKFIWVRNILVVFITSGLWHGANYNFIIWGAIHGVFYLVEDYSKFRLPKWISWLRTYLVVNLAWVFFRAPDMPVALDMLYSVDTDAFIQNFQLETGLMVGIGLFILFEFWLGNKINKTLEGCNLIIRWTIYSLLIFCILFYSGTTQHPFIYFQF